MKVLLLNTSDEAGGAAIAARRLQKALRRHDVECSMLVRDKTGKNENIKALRHPLHQLKFAAERADILFRNRSKENLWAIDTGSYGIDVTDLPEFKAADVIHLHWINQAMLSLKGLTKILQSGKPVVWTMHDMWPFTGICHHAQQCQYWKTHCHNCFLLKNPKEKDLSYQVFERKLRAYGAGKIHFVACSHWLRDLAALSPLLKGHDLMSIPNAIDTNYYIPGDKLAARKALNLPRDKKLLLFVAYKATDKNKGIDYLIEATQIIARRLPEFASQLGIVPTGLESETLKNAFACACYPQGYINDHEKMRLLYQAADLLVMPTLMDNLPNTIVEAQSCSLPCVGFRIGGLPQMIHNGINGHLANYKNADHFAELVLDTLTSNHYHNYCENARKTALDSYSEEAVAEKYINLYRECLEDA